MRGADALELARDEQAREEARRQARRTVDMRDPEGQRRVFELNFTGHAHQLAEGDFGHVMLVAEITRWVLAEEALVSARDEAQRANRAKSQFLANMSHELRTPLNAIIGYSEMLIEDLEASQAAADFSGDVERIHTSAHQLLRLINDVLDLSKIEAGKLELHYDEIDLEALLDEVEQTVHPMIQRGNNRLVSQREGLPGRADHGSRQAAPGAAQPAVERGQVHRVGAGHAPRLRDGSRWPRGRLYQGARYGHRYRAGQTQSSL